MFDIGFGELFLCFVIALIVLGPERLPKVARSVGRWTGQAKMYMRNLSSELERETQAADLKKKLDEANRMAREQFALLESQARSTAADVKDATTPPLEGPKS
ncbi:MAG: Sec-independent protein translocase protein TatB [Stagnimonas sp.]|nr:Sec-independent protein translocase protein TatB [Stagnimonas sp.]